MSARKLIYASTIALSALSLQAGAQGPNPQSQQNSNGRQHAGDVQPPHMQTPDAQQQHGSMRDMSAAPMADVQHGEMNMEQTPTTFTEWIRQHGASGTSAEPNSTPMPMLMTARRKWMVMLHGVGFFNVVEQSGERGSDKAFSTNWLMPMAQRQIGPGTFTARMMVSLEPGTVTKRYYPELFQQGETAFGKTIVDGQHPHDFIMELAALYDLKLGDNGLFSLYLAPVGDPAVGPAGYPHRASASEDPIAPLGHHLEDSTHISDDVITMGLAYKLARLEASAFHGREPDEFRWNIDSGKIDSWSLRATINPAQDWSAQYSFAHLTSLEVLHPDENVDRETASVMYNRPLARGNWASTLLWGRNRTTGGLAWNGYLAESTVRFADLNYVWGRIENVDRTNDLLFRNIPEPFNLQESVIGRVQAYTAGYERDIRLVPHLATGVGTQLTLYSTPGSLKALYGNHPVGGLVFLRVRLYS